MINIKKRYLENLFSFEASFLLFLNAGFFQNLGFLSFITTKIHIIIIFAIINIISGLYILFIKKKCFIKRNNFNIFVLFVIFCIYVLLSYINTYGFPKADSKFLQFMFILPWCSFASLLIIDNKKRAFRFICFLFIVGFIFSCNAIFSVLVLGNEVEGYHRVGRMSGALILLSIIFLLNFKNKKCKFMMFSLIIIYILGLFSSAHRAGVISLIMTLIVMLIFYLKKSKDSILNRKSLIYILIFIILVSGVLLKVSDKSHYLISRLNSLYYSISSGNNSRLLMYKESLKVWSKHPIFGVGIGGFSQSTGLNKWRHPHNIYIELLLEFGIIGFGLFVTYMFIWVPSIIKLNYKNDITIFSLIILFIFLFINIMISGDIVDNRLFFSLIGILTSSIFSEIRKYKKIDL